MNMSKSSVRVRFAPSPTGEIHIGNLRTALYDWLLARNTHGVFVLRVEDTDQIRLVPGAEERLLKLLTIFGLEYDEGPDKDGGFGPYRQSERLEIYRKQAEFLIKNNQAYYCTCSSERLDQMRKDQQSRGEASKYDGTCRDKYSAPPTEPHVIRMRLPVSGELTVTDELHGPVLFDYSTLDDFVLLKADGFPTYHLASVVDDYLMKISHVIRGDEWLPSLPKHVALYNAFKWDVPKFIHLPLILGNDRQKLSKRHGSTNVQAFLDEGYLPQAILNFIALLGWHPADDKEIYSIQELIDSFSLARLQKAPAIFDKTKLDWMNAKIIREMDATDLTEQARPFIEPYLLPEFRDSLTKSLILVKDRVRTLGELPNLLEFMTSRYSVDPKILPFKSATHQETRQALEFSGQLLASYPGPWTVKSLHDHWAASMKQSGLATGVVLWPLRVALTGKKASPGTFDVLEVLGKDQAVLRISKAINLLRDA